MKGARDRGWRQRPSSRQPRLHIRHTLGTQPSIRSVQRPALIGQPAGQDFQGNRTVVL